MLQRHNIHDSGCLKSRKAHTRSILKQIKNRNEIEEIEFELKFNSFNAKLQGIRGIKKPIRTRKKDRSKQRRSESQSLHSHLSSSGREIIDDSFCQKDEQSGRQRKMQKKEQGRRRSSKIQFKFEEIVKYSRLYPSSRNSKQIIDKNMLKLLREDFNSQKMRNSRFKPNPKQEQEKQVKNMGKSCDSGMLLNMIDNSGMEKDKLGLKYNHQKLANIIKQSKSFCKERKNQTKFQLPVFIETELHLLNLKRNGRLTEGRGKNPLPKFYSRKSHRLDLRQQKTLNIHRFFRGQHAAEEEFSDYVSRSQIEQFRGKYSIYNNIYRNIKQSLSEQKFNPLSIEELNLKSAVFLNQSLGESNPIERKKLLQSICSKIHLVP